MTTQILKSCAPGDGATHFVWVWNAGREAGCATPKPVTLADVLENYTLPRGYKILMTCKNVVGPTVYAPVYWLNESMTEGLLHNLPNPIHFTSKDGVVRSLEGDVIQNISMLAAIKFARVNAEDIRLHTYKGDL